ncbi:hypothetical protein PENANT_c042G06410 [Penicillium antarcticum]|uniref:Uncharacterized protein n=1 Tax=Penicillium antarcticum TaxID=416450 RepID=A0A1V6PSD3_9EURO|nr:hypothetical protein PENANT_c042G06410 [Penicillium antarcticum]
MPESASNQHFSDSYVSTASTNKSNFQQEANYLRDEANAYPPFDPCSKTIHLSWLGILMATFCAMACIVWALIILTTKHHLAYSTSLSEGSAEVLAFIVNIILTFITDTLGYIHTVAEQRASVGSKFLAG